MGYFMEKVVLERFGYMPFGTYGKFMFPTGETFFTVERPWLDNKQGVSCIPEGIYPLGLRYSPVIKRTSGGLFTEGWEVMDVPNRSYIMIHPGNWPDDVEGCIAVGEKVVMLAMAQSRWLPAVSNSKETFKKVMALLNQQSSWDIEITHYNPNKGKN